MKRGWTKKVKAVPACAASNDALEGRWKSVQPKLKRRVRTSVVMVGLVISMGAPNLLLTRQSDRAPAAESISNEPTASIAPVTTTEAAQNGSVNSVEPKAVESVPLAASSSAVEPFTQQVQPKAEVAPPASPVIESGQNEQSSRQYEYQVEKADSATDTVSANHQQFSEVEGVKVSSLKKPKAIAFSEKGGSSGYNNPKPPELQAEKVLRIQRENRLVQKLKARQTETLSKLDKVKRTQIIPAPATTVANQPLLDKSVIVNDEVNVKQRALINRLKQTSNRSQDSLTELTSEKSNHSSVLTTGLTSATTLTPQSRNEANITPTVVGTAGQQTPSDVPSNENAVSGLQQSSATPEPTVGILKMPELASPTLNEASVTPTVVGAAGQQMPSGGTSNENTAFGLQQLPATPEAIVGISKVPELAAPTLNEASVTPTVVELNAGQQTPSGGTSSEVPELAAPTPNARIIVPPSVGNTEEQTLVRSPFDVTSNENLEFGLQQSPATSEATVGTSEIPEPVVGNTEEENLARSPLDITSNENAVLEAQNLEPTPETIGVVPDVQDAGNELVVVGAPSLDYQVKPGDTLSAIARKQGISLPELIEANRLSDPDLIEINQQIKIPASQASSAVGQTITIINRPPQTKTTTSASTVQTVFVIPPLSPSANNSSVSVPTLPMSSEIQTKAQLIASNLPETSHQESLAVPPKPLAETPLLSTAYTGMGGSISEETEQLNTPVNDQTQLTESTLSDQELRTDIQKLQQKYYAQDSGSQLVPVVNESSTAAAPVQVPTRGTAAIRSQRINPQVRPSQSTNQPINPEFRVAQAVRTSQPAFNKRTSTQPSSAVPPKTKARVATAASSLDASEAIQSFRGRQVSPELPPLGAVDTYLPKPNSVPLKGYIWPTKGVLTSGYGWRWGRMHKGIDVAAPIGTPIVAAAPGVVVRAGWNSGGYGKLVDIKHADGTLTRYAHNNKILVQAGQQVEQGQRISEMGSTGFSTGPHLHFEVHPGGKGAVNPIAFLPGR